MLCVCLWSGVVYVGSVVFVCFFGFLFVLLFCFSRHFLVRVVVCRFVFCTPGMFVCLFLFACMFVYVFVCKLIVCLDGCSKFEVAVDLSS